MSYIGSTPTTQSFIAGTDYFNGDGSTTAFTLSRRVVSVNDIEVVINNVVQQPNTAYTVSGTTITFTSAPSAGTANIYVRYLSTTTQSIAPSQGTVGWNQLTSDVKQDLGISFKNRIINGAMVLDQRNAGASITPTDGQYDVDRWCGRLTQASKFTLQQNAGSVTPPAGFRNYLGATSTSAYSVGSGDFFAIEQWIEGYNTADLMWGTANAQTVTLSFWARSSLTGTFGGSLRTYAGGYSYPFSYSIPTANTWVNISVTITGATAGTWNTTNSGSIGVAFSLGAGSSYSAAAGAWVASTTFQPTGSVSVVGTNGATFYLTGVQLEVGTQATTFDYRSYTTELQLCQRYFCSSGGATAPKNGDSYASQQWVLTTGTCVTDASGYASFIQYPVTMRTFPTITLIGNSLATSGNWAYYSRNGGWTATTTPSVNPQATGFQPQFTTSLAGRDAFIVQGGYTASAEL